jgi:alkylation response protein AidB-like acyl-CoA dehydrogenase
VPIAVTEEHEALRLTALRWLSTHCPASEPRAAAESVTSELPAVWEKMAVQGWLGLHVDEVHGGQGYGVSELAVVLEEMGYALFPGPVLTTVLAAAVIGRFGTPEQRHRYLPGLADGTTPAALAVGPSLLGFDSASGTVTGTLRPVLGLPAAVLVLVPIAGSDGITSWHVLDLRDDQAAVTIEQLPALDATRPLGQLSVDGLSVGDDARLVGVGTEDIWDLVLVLAAAEAAGAARWCLDTASEYAKVRVQFGRPIGQFQAVKHALADMLVSVEQCAALAWDAAAAWSADALDADPETNQRELALTARMAGALCLQAAARCAQKCIQLLGGIGFTWEHDAHFYLKRAMATRQLLTDVGALEHQVANLAMSGARRGVATDLPADAETVRAEIRPLVAQVAARAEDPGAQRAAWLETGLLAPHWPRPWGRAASPLEQLVIDEELAQAGIHRPHLAVGAWALPTIIGHGTEDQQERWVRPTMLGQLSWCQLFSEPGAGSDLAALTTKAEKVDGGYLLNGQKVWTSLAQTADWGICLARSDPDAPKHAGITYLIVDMRAEGIDIRPLRELTGAAMFNEVFFNDVFVPDDAVIGQPGDGWRIGRTTLANERVSMSSGASFGPGVESLVRTLARYDGPASPSWVGQLGHLVIEAQSLALLGQRSTLRTLSGVDPGAGASVRKLLGVEHEQRVQEMGMALYGADGAVLDGRAQRWEDGFLSTRCLTIAGGTSEVQRNVIAERILGQPKDPEPGT